MSWFQMKTIDSNQASLQIHPKDLAEVKKKKNLTEGKNVLFFRIIPVLTLVHSGAIFTGTRC